MNKNSFLKFSQKYQFGASQMYKMCFTKFFNPSFCSFVYIYPFSMIQLKSMKCLEFFILLIAIFLVTTINSNLIEQCLLNIEEQIEIPFLSSNLWFSLRVIIDGILYFRNRICYKSIFPLNLTMLGYKRSHSSCYTDLFLFSFSFK